MKKQLLTFLLVATSFSIYGQAVNEEDIVWQVETEFEYQLENDSLLNFEYQNRMDTLFGTRSEVKTGKIDLTKHFNRSYYMFRRFLIRSIYKELLSAYTITENKKIPTKKMDEFLTTMDSTVTIHPETGEKEVNYSVNYFEPLQIKSFIIKQRWSFNRMTNQLYSEVLGVIPVVQRKGVEKQLFWIPMNNVSIVKPFDFNNPNYTWVKVSEDIVSFDEAKVIKGENSKWLEKTLLEKVRKGEIEGLEPVGGDPFSKYPLSERELDIMLNPQIDTIIAFNPQTMEEKISIHKMKGIKATDIIGLKIFQYWFIDEEKNTFNTQLIAFSPIVKDEDSTEEEIRITIPFRINFH